MVDPHLLARDPQIAFESCTADQRLVTAAWWSLLALLWVALGWEVFHRGVDPDEFEHLHAAFSVSRGEVPYRDFFEHHAPALYYLLLPLFRLLGPEWSVLTGGRLVSLACAAGTLLVTCSVARRVLGWRSGLPVAAVLSATTVFHLKAIELRPDVPAMLFLSLSLWAAIQPSKFDDKPRWPGFLLVGFLCGLATAFTQKSLVPASGLALGMLLMAALEPQSFGMRWRRLAGGAAAFAAGGLLVWGVIFGLFAVAGAAESLWHSAFYQLWIWPVKSGRFEHLRPTLAADLTIWLAVLCEVAVGLRDLCRRERPETGRGILVVAVSVCLLSLVVVKATFPQFYLLWFLWLVLLAMRRWKIWFEAVSGRRLLWILILGLLAIPGIEGWLINRTLQQPRGGAFEHLMQGSMTSSVEAVWLPTMLLIVTAALLGYLLSRKIRVAAVIMLSVTGMAYGQLRALDAVEWSQTPQRERVEAINARVGINETILDGFTGYGALRRHAYYFWWINEYSQALMKPEQRSAGLLATLEKNPPAALLFDRNLRQLPPEVVAWLEARYRPEQEPLWLPKLSDDQRDL